MTTPGVRPARPLHERVVVVAGGRGLVGGAVVRALLAAGARVVVPTRAPGPAGLPGVAGGLPDLQTGLDAEPAERLRMVTIASWDDPVELTALVRTPGWAPDAVVASVGGWWMGPELTALAPNAWRALVETHLTSHFLVARALAPLVAAGPDPVYVTLNGAAAREPMALSGPVSIAGVGQTMLLAVLRREEIGRTVRFHEVTVLAAVQGDERNQTPATTVTRGQVAGAVLGVLADPGSAPWVEVGPSPAWTA